ncbi:MAG: hypothetical protein IPP71_18890 [Bacteroidetes bacterium]|nr:hypothetical protein [Bacteroidota bacterium]
MKMKILGSMFILLVVSVLSGCYPDGPGYVEEYDVVYTNHDENFNFSGKRFYAIPDSVVRVNGAVLQGDPLEFVRPQYGNAIIERLKTNMLAQGYTLTADTSIADLILFLVCLK